VLLKYEIHRRAAEIAEKDYFLFAVERPRLVGMQATANKNTQALQAKKNLPCECYGS
jgi:hypothetical protein